MLDNVINIVIISRTFSQIWNNCIRLLFSWVLFAVCNIKYKPLLINQPLREQKRWTKTLAFYIKTITYGDINKLKQNLLSFYNLLTEGFCYISAHHETLEKLAEHCCIKTTTGRTHAQDRRACVSIT